MIATTMIHAIMTNRIMDRKNAISINAAARMVARSLPSQVFGTTENLARQAPRNHPCCGVDADRILSIHYSVRHDRVYHRSRDHLRHLGVAQGWSPSPRPGNRGR